VNDKAMNFCCARSQAHRRNILMFRSYIVSANAVLTCGGVADDLNSVSTDRPVAQDSTSTESERKVVETEGNEMHPLDSATSTRKFFANCVAKSASIIIVLVLRSQTMLMATEQ
jgi:hypothetical protein